MSRLCLVAGAGAGKTTRLVAHYLSLLAGEEGREPLAPSQIVAITFTEKAAAEMRARISQEVGPDVAAELAWAPINTIHGFAAGLLRDYGLALGVDPEFAVLDAEEHARLLAETTDDLLRQGLAQKDPTLSRLLAHYALGGSNGLAGVLVWLHSRLATLAWARSRQQRPRPRRMLATWPRAVRCWRTWTDACPPCGICAPRAR